MRDATCAITMRDIDVDEQITIDYAMVRNGKIVLEGDIFTPSICRGNISPLDYTNIDLKFFKYFSPFVQEICVNDMTGGITRNLTVDST